MPDAVRLAPEPEQPPVVADAVDDRRGHLVVAEDGPPPAELQVGGYHERLPLVGLRDDLEEQPRAVHVERQEAELVDPEQLRPRELGELAVERPAVTRPPEPHDQGGRREEPRLAHRLAAERAQRLQHVRLPVMESFP